MILQRKQLKTYILVHGAWQANWCWKRILPILIGHGHTVIAPDLPGHGKNKMPASSINLRTYVDSISDVVMSSDKPVVLVGHSMGGVVISQVTENMPEKIDQLIFVTAFIPGNHESLLQEVKKAKTSSVLTELIIDEVENEVDLKKTPQIKELFFNTCCEEDASQFLGLLQKEPFQPFIDPINISKEKFGVVKKLYIECLKDKALKPEDQKRMHSFAKCEVISISNADHSPFFSAPIELANAFLGKI
jgi:pimeloyl-ACP methyl ester carboxylesterase